MLMINSVKNEQSFQNEKENSTWETVRNLKNRYVGQRMPEEGNRMEAIINATVSRGV